VDSGVNNAQELRRHIRLLVSDLFKPRPLPPTTNRRFWPSRSDIRYLVYLENKRLVNGLLDQELLAKKIDSWRLQRPDDCWYYRQSVQEQGSEVDFQLNGTSSNAAVGNAENFLLIHQTSWQKRLLIMYGQELVFMDATYRTTKYAIPMFFICVHTNCGYFVVGVIVVEKEDSQSLAEALRIFSNMNNQWSPKAFMIDASDMEMKAISLAFTGR
jgi:MULE transposase domain